MITTNQPHLGTETEIGGTTFTIEAEIECAQTGNPSKMIYLQKLRAHYGVEFRTCRYSLQPNGSWKFVNGTMMAPQSDFIDLLNEARNRVGFLQ